MKEVASYPVEEGRAGNPGMALQMRECWSWVSGHGRVLPPGSGQGHFRGPERQCGQIGRKQPLGQEDWRWKPSVVVSVF